MKVVVITNDSLKEELLAQELRDDVQVEWQDEISALPGVDGYIDLLFNDTAERISRLKNLQPAIIIVNAVKNTASDLPAGFTRINGWNSFLKRPVVEAAATGTSNETAEKILSCFNKRTEWVPDIPGFITARVISMIINEAYFTLGEEVSTKEEIDTAMKLGTNYPYGPFEWAEKIGLKNVYELLSLLSGANSRYQPAVLLKKEALS